jgi:hypothetical protein
MASESLKYVIDAEDNASVKFEKLKKEIDSNVKSVKDFGGKAKIATEFTGTLAGVLGDTKFAGAASVLASITEKTSQLSEMMKTGGTGALAFKAGVLAAAGAIAYQLAYSITRAVVGMDELEKKLVSLKSQFQNTASGFQSALRQSLALDEELSSLRGGGEAEAFFESLNVKIANLRDELAMTNAQEMPEFADALRAELQIYEEQREAIAKRKDARVLEIQAIKEQQAIEQKSKDFIAGLREEVERLGKSEAEIDEIKARQSTHDADSLQAAMDLLKIKHDHLAAVELQKKHEEQAIKDAAEYAQRMKDHISEIAKADEQAQEEERKRWQEKYDAQKKLFDINQSLVTNLRQQLTLQKDGSVAARAFALEQQGVGSQMAKMFAEFEDQLAGLGNQAKEMAPSTNTASESRLMSGVQTIDQRAIEAKRLAEINIQQKIVLEQMDVKLGLIEAALSLPQIVVGT